MSVRCRPFEFMGSLKTIFAPPPQLRFATAAGPLISAAENTLGLFNALSSFVGLLAEKGKTVELERQISSMMDALDEKLRQEEIRSVFTISERKKRMIITLRRHREELENDLESLRLSVEAAARENSMKVEKYKKYYEAANAVLKSLAGQLRLFAGQIEIARNSGVSFKQRARLEECYRESLKKYSIAAKNLTLEE